MKLHAEVGRSGAPRHEPQPALPVCGCAGLPLVRTPLCGGGRECHQPGQMGLAVLADASETGSSCMGVRLVVCSGRPEGGLPRGCSERPNPQAQVRSAGQCWFPTLGCGLRPRGGRESHPKVVNRHDGRLTEAQPAEEHGPHQPRGTRGRPPYLKPRPTPTSHSAGR